MVAEGYDVEVETWDTAVEFSAALTAQTESKAKTHGFKDKIPQTTALFPDPLTESLLNTREHVSWVCCSLFLCAFVFFLSFFLFSFFLFFFCSLDD